MSAQTGASSSPDNEIVTGVTFAERMDQLRELLPEPVLQIWSLVESYPIIGSLVLLLLGIVLAVLARWLTSRATRVALTRLGAGRHVRAAERVQRPIFITVLVLFLILAILQLTGGGSGFIVIGNFLASIVIISWLLALIPVSRMLLEMLSYQHHRIPVVDPRTLPLFNIIAMLALIALASYILLILWGINPAAWLASAGILGIAIGFAARDTLANLFAGVSIIADAPYKIGDWINLDGGDRGMVTAVGLRSTRILNRDDQEITIPNAIIANSRIINESAGPTPISRIRVAVGVAYGSDVHEVTRILEQVAKSSATIVQDPEPRARMRAFGDSSLNFELMCWIERPENRGLISHQLYMAVNDAFQAHGISIPFPQRDVHVYPTPAPRAAAPVDNLPDA
ncbi:MAG: mechanosensitive ion channel [Gammaproteobacteria bacterium]|jgi:MscS family membrane protein|nr:mechanosensitive ion channel [Gammaproteobacteria bacterium]